MKEHYVSFECAVKLKELGFYWKCDHFYDGNKRLLESSIFSHTYRVSDYWHNFNEYDRNNHRQSLCVNCSAPRLDQAAAWIRDCKGIDIEVTTILRNPVKKTKCYMSNISYFSKDMDGNDCGNYVRAGIDIHSYEKALELGISKALELLGKEEKP